MLTRPRTAIASTALLAAVAGAMFWWSRGSGPKPLGQVNTPHSPGETAARLERGLQAVAAGERDAPRDRWDPGYVVEQLGRNPDSLRAWVRQNTAWIPYRGVLRGAPGVLMDRQGSSLDRALLLSTLLERAGHRVRLARGRLAEPTVTGLLPGLLARTVRVSEAPSDSSDAWVVRAAAAEYKLDAKEVEASFTSQAWAMDTLMRTLNERVAEQTRRLLAELPPPPRAADSLRLLDWAAESLRDHWWVQVAEGDAWRDLDLLDATRPAAEAELTPSALPDSVYHTLSIRVLAEQQEEAGRRERVVLAHALRPWELNGRSITLQLWPASWPKELHSNPQSELGLRGRALSQHEWVASLGVGDSAVVSGTIGQGEGTAGAAPGNPLGGLGGAMAAAARSNAADPEVTAVWIEYVVRAPGRPVRTWRRAVFDLVGPAVRAAGSKAPLVPTDAQRLQRSLALMMRTELLPVTSAPAPEFGLHLVAQSLLANADRLRAFTRSGGSLSDDRDSLLRHLTPGPSPLHALALARLEWSRLRRWLYVDQIGLLARHRHIGPVGDGYVVRGAFEIIARDLGVAPGGPGAFSTRVEQGVFDTNAEALWWKGEGLNSTADAFEREREWVVIGDAGRGAVDRLAVQDDARARMREDLAAGLTIVAPSRPVTRGPDRFTGWWRIDPVTGATAGTPANGWAQCGSEYSVHLTVAAEMVESMAFEYAFCHGMAQAVNEFKRFVKSFGHLLYAGPIAVLRPSEVVAANDKACIKGAIMAGMFATLPFLIIQTNRWAEFGLVARQLPGRPKPFLEQGPNNTIKFDRSRGGGLGGTGPYQPPEFASTEPGLLPAGRGPAGEPPPRAPSQPDLAPNGRGPAAPGNPGPSAPPAAEGPAPSPRTGPPSGRPGGGEPAPAPNRYPPTNEGVDAARQAYEDALVQDRAAWDDLMAYRDQYPVNGRWGWQYDHPGFNPQKDSELADAMLNAHYAKQQAGEELNAAIEGRRNASPPAPEPAPAPAPASSPGGRIAAGASQSAASFWDSPWDL